MLIIRLLLLILICSGTAYFILKLHNFCSTTYQRKACSPNQCSPYFLQTFSITHFLLIVIVHKSEGFSPVTILHMIVTNICILSVPLQCGMYDRMTGDGLKC